MLFTGFIIGLAFGSNLVYLAMLAYVHSDFPIHNAVFGVPENILIITLTLMATNVRSHNRFYIEKTQNLSNLLLENHISVFIISGNFLSPTLP